jgi:outer membrane lipoprotein carrier protein
MLLALGPGGRANPGFCENQTPQQLAELLSLVEKRYQQSDFTVHFTQASTLKAMEITETASGRLMAKPPGKMRWEYETPEPQLIITDGKQLWIYRPQDNQVMIGRAPALFGGGKGAGFLADIQGLQETFTISLAADQEKDKTEPAEVKGSDLPSPESTLSAPVLKLVPRKETPDMASAYLTLDPATGEVLQIISYNHYQDETRIELSRYDFATPLADRLFQFEIPEDADILSLDE